MARRVKFDEDEVLDADVMEAERWKMLRFIVWMGVLGFIVMVGGAIAMYPNAVGFVVGIGYTAWSVGFAVGRYVFRQERDKHEEAMAKMASSVARMEGLMTGGAQHFLEEARKEAEHYRALTDELQGEVERERDARRQVQREHAEYVRDHGG